MCRQKSVIAGVGSRLVSAFPQGRFTPKLQAHTCPPMQRQTVSAGSYLPAEKAATTGSGVGGPTQRPSGSSIVPTYEQYSKGSLKTAADAVAAGVGLTVGSAVGIGEGEGEALTVGGDEMVALGLGTISSSSPHAPDSNERAKRSHGTAPSSNRLRFKRQCLCRKCLVPPKMRESEFKPEAETCIYPKPSSPEWKVAAAFQCHFPLRLPALIPYTAVGGDPSCPCSQQHSPVLG